MPAACVLAFGLLVGSTTGAAWGESPPATPRIDVYPPDVNLETSRDRQQFIVVATRPDGVTEDVTAKAKATVADANLARLDGSTLYPVADGQTTLAVEYEGQSVSFAVTVKDSAARPPISFKQDVMAVFTRAGCNVGSCHGAARGKD